MANGRRQTANGKRGDENGDCFVLVRRTFLMVAPEFILVRNVVMRMMIVLVLVRRTFLMVAPEFILVRNVAM